MDKNSGSGERVLTRKVSVGSKKVPLAGSVTCMFILLAREALEEAMALRGPTERRTLRANRTLQCLHARAES